MISIDEARRTPASVAYIELAAKVDEDMGLLPGHVLLIFNHAAEQKASMFRKHFS